MHPKTPKWLQDILDACDLIDEVSSNQTRESFVQDEISKAAVERKFGAIGEALNRINRVDPATAQRVPQCRMIIGFRHVLIHGYDDIDYNRVWHVIRDDVPPLRRLVLDLLAEAGPPPDE